MSDMSVNGLKDSPVSCSHNLGIWTLAERLGENGQGASNSTLGCQDPSIVRGNVICKACSVALSVPNALTANLAGTKGTL